MNTAMRGNAVVHILPGHAYELSDDLSLNPGEDSTGRKRKIKPLGQKGTRFVCMEDGGETYLQAVEQRKVHLQGDSLTRALPMLVEVEPSLEEILMSSWQRADDVLKQLLSEGVLTIDRVRAAALVARAHFDAQCDEEERQFETEQLAPQ